MSAKKPPAKKKRAPATRKRSSVHSRWTRMDYLVDALAHLETLAREAGEKSFTAAVQAKRAALDVRAQIDQLRETERRLAAPASTADHKVEILTEVRRLRTGATEAGSYVAAAGLLRLEREMLAIEEAERRAAEAEQLAGLPDADLRAEAEALLAALDGEPPPTPQGLRVIR